MRKTDNYHFENLTNLYLQRTLTRAANISFTTVWNRHKSRAWKGRWRIRKGWAVLHNLL